MLFNLLIKTMLLAQIVTFLGIPELSQNAPKTVGDGQVAGDMVVIERPSRLINQSLGLEISAKSAIAIDNLTGKILFEKEINQKRPIASITKLASALVFFDHQVDLDKQLTILRSEEVEGGRLYVSPGEIVTVENLFYTSLVGSANNTTLSLARSTGLNRPQFVEAMNQKMKNLGLTNTSFEEPTGLSEHNLSTAHDVVRLLNYALENDLIKKALSTKVYDFDSVTGRHHSIKNTDQLLGSYLNVQGGKTGFTDEAGNCFVARIEGPQKQIITVAVLGTDSASLRFQEVKAIAQWVFDNWQW